MRRLIAWVRHRPGVFRIWCWEHPDWPIARIVCRREFTRWAHWRAGHTDTAPFIVRAAMTLGVPPAEHDEFVLATLAPALPRAMRAEITDAIS